MDLSDWPAPGGYDCICGKHHSAAPLRCLKIGKGVIQQLPELLRELSIRHLFLIMDDHTALAAGKTVQALLAKQGIPFSAVCLEGEPRLLPNEDYLEQLEQRFDKNADCILGIGSGVINDLSKLLAFRHDLPAGIIATAPSMDGYASNSSAMELAGVKTTVYTTCPSLIVCDTDILKTAPHEMFRAGLGDMAAKIISTADWRIAHLVTGEYYCDQIAALMTKACDTVLENAGGIVQRNEEAIEQMTAGLVLSGIAMTCAGVSRPASGMEHTISHLLEMFALARGKRPALHGIQVGYGVRAALALYRKASSFTPTIEKCRTAAFSFDKAAWKKAMEEVFGQQATVILQDAETDGRNDGRARFERGMRAIEHWAEIRQIINDVLQKETALVKALDLAGIPALSEIETLGFSRTDSERAVLFSKDLRTRYIFTSLCADIGLIRCC